MTLNCLLFARLNFHKIIKLSQSKRLIFRKSGLNRICPSCKHQIKKDSIVLAVRRAKYIYSGYFSYVSKIPNKYLCNECGEILINLSELDYNVGPDENLKMAMAEYQGLTGFNPNRYINKKEK